MNKLQANLCLLCVTLCWSTEIIMFTCIPDSVSPYATTCLTSAAGGALLIAAFRKRVFEALRAHGAGLVKACILLGILDGAYNTMYIFGLNDFDVSTGAFTLSMTVVVLPVILLTLHKKTDLNTWISAGLVLIGIFLSYIGHASIGQAGGFFLIFGGCIIRAVYIIELNKYARRFDPLTMSALMCVIVTVISFVIWFVCDNRTFASVEWTKQLIAIIFIYAYFIVAFAQTVNFFAQRRTTPASATVIYSLEIVFSIILGIILPANLVAPVKLTPSIIIGMLFVVAGNLVNLIDFKAARKKGGDSV